MSKRILNITAILLTIICVLLIGGYIYIKFVMEQRVQIAGAFVSDQIDPQTGISYPLLEVNYYSNGNGKGEEVLEFILNVYSESDYQTIYSRGVQFIDGQFYSLESNNGHSWMSAGDFVVGKNAKILPIKIGEENFGISLNGTYETFVPKLNGWRTFGLGVATLATGGFGAGVLGLFGYSIYDYKETTVEYTLVDFCNYLKDLARSHSNGYGNTYIPAIDLSEYFSIYKLVNGSYESIIPYNDTNQSMYYFSAQIHYDYRGLTLAKQSMFGSVAGDSQFNITGFPEVEYWQSDVNISLNNNDYAMRFSEEHNGYLLSLSVETLTKLNNYECNIVCDIDVDLDSFDKEIVGIDYYGFSGVKIKNLNLSSSSNRIFKILDYSLLNTDIQNFSKTNNITLEISDIAGGGL